MSLIFPRFLAPEINQVFRLLEEPLWRSSGPAFGRFLAEGHARPAVNLQETEAKYLLEAELPGYTRDELKVEFSDENQTLVISGQRVDKSQVDATQPSATTETPEVDNSATVDQASEKAASVVRAQQPHSWLSERSSHQFRRSFRLPEKIDIEAVKANLRDGLLRLELPKVARVGPRAVNIE